MTELSEDLLAYHHRSKHRVNRYAPGPTGLDWANQPDPFRVFQGAVQLKLQLAADSLATRYNELRLGNLPPLHRFDLDHLATCSSFHSGCRRGNPTAPRGGHCVATLPAAICIRPRAICYARAFPACPPGSITT